MIGFSVIFILVFSSLVLWGHKKNIERFLYFKTRYSVFIIKEAFEDILKSETLNQSILKNSLSSLKDLGVVENAMIVDEKANVLVRTEANYIKSLPETDIGNAFSSTKPYLSIAKDPYIYNLIKIPNNLMIITISSAATIQKALNEVTIPIVGIILFVVIANFALAALLSKILINPISSLFSATTSIAKGNLQKRVQINTGDELEVLAKNFNFMTQELIKMKAKAENANPLTKLPGNIVIQEETEKRIKENKKFVVIYCDLDNFKAFNDKYGVHKGDDAIKLTAGIFKEAVGKEGSFNDFIGHEGGDDFLLITDPEKSQKIADYITAEFDKQIKGLYSKEDLDKGYIEAKARNTEQIMKFPIMTISLAGVTNINRDIKTYSEVTNIAAELKKKAKNVPGSCFVIDQRKS